MFIQDWHSILQIFVTTLIIYPVLILLLRLGGKRTLSKWNAFDFVATIALGSTFATVILSKDIVVLDGIFALLLIIVLQFTLTFFSVRVQWVEDLVKSKPTLLYYNDEFLWRSMKNKRVSKSEILSAIRASSIGSLEKVEAVVLETDGSFSVIEKTEAENDNSALEDVEGFSGSD